MRSLALSLLLFWTPLSDDALAAECRVAGTSLYYANGMFNSYDDAVDGLLALQELGFSEVETSSDRLRFGLSYNISEPWWQQLLEVANQKLNSDFSLLWRIAWGLTEVPENFRAEYSLLLFKLLPLGPVDDEELTVHVDRYRRDLQEGRKIVIVSHSQGNFYAAQAMSQLASGMGDKQWDAGPKEKGLGNVGVATPALMTDDYFPWTTFADDLVIKSVSSLLGAGAANLPAIGAGPPPTRDPLGHNFIKAYLQTPESRSKIRSDVLRVAKEVSYSNYGTQALRVSFKFPKDSGFGMRVSKPEDVKSSWRSNLEPTDPAYDVERYVLFCSDLRPGTYVFKADTFFVDPDRAPYPAELEIEAGSIKKQYSAMFKQSAEGSRPAEETMATIVVEEASPGRFTFQVKSPLKEKSR